MAQQQHCSYEVRSRLPDEDGNHSTRPCGLKLLLDDEFETGLCYKHQDADQVQGEREQLELARREHLASQRKGKRRLDGRWAKTRVAALKQRTETQRRVNAAQDRLLNRDEEDAGEDEEQEEDGAEAIKKLAV